MSTKFHENQGPITYVLTCYKHKVLNHRNVKYAISILQCKTYSNIDFSLNDHDTSLFIVGS